MNSSTTGVEPLPAGGATAVTPALTALLATACGVAVASVYYGQPIITDIGTGLAVPESRLGLVTTIAQGGYLAGLILVVPLGDRLNRRRLIIGCSCSRRHR